MENEMRSLLSIFDPAKIDKAKLKSAVALAADAMKPSTTFLADLDDMLWDQLKNVANMFIDKLGVADGGKVTVGDSEGFTAADVAAYLGTFSVIAPEAKEALKKKPRLMKLLKEEFTAEQQAKIVGNPFLIGLISIFGPLIVEWIKNWLSK